MSHFQPSVGRDWRDPRGGRGGQARRWNGGGSFGVRIGAEDGPAIFALAPECAK